MGRLEMDLARLIRPMPPALAERWCWASVPNRSNPEWTSSVARVLLQHPLSRWAEANSSPTCAENMTNFLMDLEVPYVV
jgi:hypothetical protein